MKAIIKRLTILAMAILAIGFWGCSNNDVEDKNPVLGKESAYFLFSFTTEGKSLRTTDPVNALPSEVTVNTVDVYVYDGATFERHVSLLFSDFQESTPGSNIWVLKEAKKNWSSCRY